MPFIFNTTIPNPYEFGIDSIRHNVDVIPWEYGQWQTHTDEAMVDVPLEMSVEDLADKLNDFRCYHDLMPKRNPVFDWSYWRGYYSHKFGQKSVSGEELSPMGKRIAAISQPHFVSHTVLQEIGINGTVGA
jgi:hypothetical protein